MRESQETSGKLTPVEALPSRRFLWERDLCLRLAPALIETPGGPSVRHRAGPKSWAVKKDSRYKVYCNFRGVRLWSVLQLNPMSVLK